jgi:hypothetical protein
MIADLSDARRKVRGRDPALETEQPLRYMREDRRFSDRETAGERGGQGRSRTADLPLFRRTLYQLSYLTGRKVGGGV